MAKAKDKVTKADRVREYMAQHPDAKPKDAGEALKRYGITAQYVSMVKMNDRKASAGANGGESAAAPAASGAKRGRPPGKKSVASSGKLSTQSILAAAEFIQQCGGLSEAREAMAVAEKIGSAIR